MTKRTDEDITALFFARSEEAIRELSAKYGAWCHEVAYRILGNDADAEECVNDTWLRVWNAVPPEKPAHFKYYLAKITRGLALDRYRKKHAEKRRGAVCAIEELDACVPSGDCVEAEICAEEMRAGINRFLHGLPARECDIFLRRYFYAEDIKTIAKRCGMKEQAVRMALTRTRRKLTDYLVGEGLIHEG